MAAHIADRLDGPRAALSRTRWHSRAGSLTSGAWTLRLKKSANSRNSSHPIPSDSSSSLPRAERVAHVWSRSDHAGQYAQEAQQTLSAAKRFKSQDRQFQDWIRWASYSWLQAISHLVRLTRKGASSARSMSSKL
jgi:hypothetical protein